MLPRFAAISAVFPLFALALALAPLASLGGCSSSSATEPSDAGGLPAFDGGGGWGDAEPLDASPPNKHPDSGLFVYDDGGVALRADRFVTKVESFSPTECTGFGAANMPDTVLGPPVGGGTDQGGLDVVSLGSGGSIVLSFGANAIVDGPGPDFLVFENPFLVGGSPDTVFAEPGEVSVSDDGTTWTTFPCTATSYPYGSCAGWHPVFSSPGNGISPVDPGVAGGDPFDLADVGVTHARFVRIVDKTHETCPTTPANKANTNGFDLDAIAIVNAATP